MPKKPPDLIDKRMASALFRGARPTARANVSLGGGGRMGMGVANRLMGGLWVGGNAWLTREALSFELNGPNRAFLENGEEIETTIPLTAIEGVSWRRGFVTSIIEIDAGEDELSLRCYNSKTFAAAIEAAVAEARGAA